MEYYNNVFTLTITWGSAESRKLLRQRFDDAGYLMKAAILALIVLSVLTIPVQLFVYLYYDYSATPVKQPESITAKKSPGSEIIIEEYPEFAESRKIATPYIGVPHCEFAMLYCMEPHKINMRKHVNQQKKESGLSVHYVGERAVNQTYKADYPVFFITPFWKYKMKISAEEEAWLKQNRKDFVPTQDKLFLMKGSKLFDLVSSGFVDIREAIGYGTFAEDDQSHDLKAGMPFKIAFMNSAKRIYPRFSTPEVLEVPCHILYNSKKLEEFWDNNYADNNYAATPVPRESWDEAINNMRKYLAENHEKYQEDQDKYFNKTGRDQELSPYYAFDKKMGDCKIEAEESLYFMQDYQDEVVVIPCSFQGVLMSEEDKSKLGKEERDQFEREGVLLDSKKIFSGLLGGEYDTGDLVYCSTSLGIEISQETGEMEYSGNNKELKFLLAKKYKPITIPYSILNDRDALENKRIEYLNNLGYSYDSRGYNKWEDIVSDAQAAFRNRGEAIERYDYLEEEPVTDIDGCSSLSSVSEQDPDSPCRVQ
jgi:hypothetical protein